MFKKSKLFSLLALFSLLLLAFPVGMLGAEVQTKQFNYSGGQQSWVVPNGVSSIKIEAYGAAGGNDTARGGYGGYASGDLAVTAGQTLYFYVGGQGASCVAGWGGGFNGGGNAGYYGCSGGGGGASDVRVGGTQLSHRVIVAGGGGGGGQNMGGAGGGTTNLVGLGQGAHHPGDGGGGGGGYYGGNYGSTTSYYWGYGYYTSPTDTGGYGGSSFIGGVTNGTQVAGINNWNGRIIVSYSVSDTIAPTGTIAYSTVAATNQDVIATLSTSEPVTITNNGGSSTYTFSDNGSFTFEFIDAAGNTGSAIASVSNIDKVAPTGTITYSTEAATNQDVIVALSTSEPVTITNNGGSSTYTFSDNGSFTFEFIDAAGNTGSAIASVSNIDKVAPTLSFVLDKTSLWSPNHKLVTITAQVNAADDISDVAIVLTSITSNESDFDPSLVDDDGANDIQNIELGTQDTIFDLRAERAGSGNGRIYTVTYTAIDAAGNATTATAEVVVPHRQGSNGAEVKGKKK